MKKKITAAKILVCVLFLALSIFLLGKGVTEIEKQLYPCRYDEYVQASAEEYGLDPYLVYAFIRTESGFNVRAVSEVGARGLMQITGETYEWIHSTLEPDLPVNFDEMYEAEKNIRYGCYFISVSLQKYGGDIATAAAAYHSGWGTVDRLLSESRYSRDAVRLTTFPYEQMNHYVYKIQANYRHYQTLYGL